MKKISAQTLPSCWYLLLRLCVVLLMHKIQQPLWKDFVEAKKTGKTPTLPDFSYAGYHFSEKEIPNVAGRKYFNVKDFGAVSNDDQFDDEAIQKGSRRC
jgi:hypothetical protein